MGCPMKKPEVKPRRGEGKPGCEDKFLKGDCPTLVQFLTDDKYDDGTPRERCTITLFVEDGKIKAALNDKNVQASMFRSADAVLDVLEALEAALSDGEGDSWYPWKKNRK